jgi:anti-sigma B factor antagonist
MADLSSTSDPVFPPLPSRLPGLRPTDVSVTLTWLWPEAMVMVVGEVDHFSAPSLVGRLREAIDAGATRITLDASGLTFLDAAGMRCLTAAARSLRERGGDLVVLDLRPSLARVLGVLGLDRRLTLVPPPVLP